MHTAPEIIIYGLNKTGWREWRNKVKSMALCPDSVYPYSMGRGLFRRKRKWS